MCSRRWPEEKPHKKGMCFCVAYSSVLDILELLFRVSVLVEPQNGMHSKDVATWSLYGFIVSRIAGV